MIIGATGTGLGVTPSHHQHVDRVGGLATDEWLAHQRGAELLCTHGAFPQGGIDTAMSPLVHGDEAEVGQAVHRAATTGGVDQLEQSVPPSAKALVGLRTECQQLARPGGREHG